MLYVGFPPNILEGSCTSMKRGRQVWINMILHSYVAMSAQLTYCLIKNSKKANRELKILLTESL